MGCSLLVVERLGCLSEVDAFANILSVIVLLLSSNIVRVLICDLLSGNVFVSSRLSTSRCLLMTDVVFYLLFVNSRSWVLFCKNILIVSDFFLKSIWRLLGIRRIKVLNRIAFNAYFLSIFLVDKLVVSSIVMLLVFSRLGILITLWFWYYFWLIVYYNDLFNL